MKRTAEQLYNDIEKPRLIEEAKGLMIAEQKKPIMVMIDRMRQFEGGEDAKAELAEAINSFEAVRTEAVSGGWPNDGTIPWVDRLGAEFAITLPQLESVRDAMAVRAFNARASFKSAVAAL